MKKFVLGFIMGAIMFGSVVFAATTYLYKSTEVGYVPSDSSWKVDNVGAALDELKTTSGNALINLKNTNIAKAVGANGSTLSSVISTLGNITNRGIFTQTINPGGSVTLSPGYYSGGKITANPNQNSATFTPSSHGTQIDMGANNTYRYINTTNVWNQGYNSGKTGSNLNYTGPITSDFFGETKTISCAVGDIIITTDHNHLPNVTGATLLGTQVDTGNTIRCRIWKATSTSVVINPTGWTTAGRVYRS